MITPFEIVPKEIYSDADLNWRDRSSRVNKEHDDVALQDIELDPKTLDKVAGGWSLKPACQDKKSSHAY